MLNIVWILMLILSVIFGVINHKIDLVVKSITTSAETAFTLALGMTGVMCFWLGIMNVAEQSGLVQSISRKLKPVLQYLFPDIPKDSPALGSIVMNIVANMLGISNAATPLGLKAMEELEHLNKNKGVATDAMCMFLAINTSSVQLIPTTAILYLSSAGATSPTDVIASSFLATLASTVIAIISAKLLARFF